MPTEMTGELFDKGMKIRREVLGDAYVDRALAKCGPFNEPLQELVTDLLLGLELGPRRPAAARPQPDQPRHDRDPQPPATS